MAQVSRPARPPVSVLKRKPKPIIDVRVEGDELDA